MEYKNYTIDLANGDEYVNYIIYDRSSGEYLKDSPVFHSIESAKYYIDYILN